jgi:hypothetical protein
MYAGYYRLHSSVPCGVIFHSPLLHTPLVGRFALTGRRFISIMRKSVSTARAFALMERKNTVFHYIL